MKDLMQRSFNGINYSLEGHTHTHFQLYGTYSCFIGVLTEQSINPKTTTKILFNEVIHDLGSNFNVSNNRFTIPLNGVYGIDCGLYFNSTANGSMYIYKNGSLIHNFQSSINTYYYDGYYENQFLAGDYIEIWNYNSTGRNTVPNHTFLSIFFITGI